MKAAPLTDLSRLAVHTITTKPWSLAEAARRYEEAGVPGITVWRDAFPGMTPKVAGRLLADHGRQVVAYCRGGFFPAADKAGRQAAIDDNKRCLDEAAAIGAPLVVLVCGAVPGQSLELSRRQITDGIAACLPHAESLGVKLSIEPLHPMYAGDRSAINTLKQANDVVEALNHPLVGVAIDVYHVWWDDQLASEIARCGRLNAIHAFHVCDWRIPTEDLLLDRGLMGEGCIPLQEIRAHVEKAGFTGMIEVEIFSKRWWATDQADFLEKIKSAYLTEV